MNVLKSAYKAVVEGLQVLLARAGIRVGEGAGYPRVEVHTVTESERLDKNGDLRLLSLTVESISDRSMTECEEMLQENLERLASGNLDVTPEGFELVGTFPQQLQDLTESSDTNNIIYRLLQTVDIYVSRNLSINNQ